MPPEGDGRHLVRCPQDDHLGEAFVAEARTPTVQGSTKALEVTEHDVLVHDASRSRAVASEHDGNRQVKHDRGRRQCRGP